MHIVIMGGSGFIGSALTAKLVTRGDSVVIPTRKIKNQSSKYLQFKPWDGKDPQELALMFKNADAVINLIGHNISEGRWTELQKKRILQSRLNASNAMMQALESLEPAERPKTLIQGSALGYYGGFKDFAKLDASSCQESLPPPAGLERGFLASVAAQWEACSDNAPALGLRRVIIRTAVVLDHHGGALPHLILPFKFYVGGALGSGKQPFAWIHLADEVGAILHLLDNESLSGAYNLAAPESLSMQSVAKTLGELMQKPAFFQVPAFILKLLLGQMAEEILLSGQKAQPTKLLASGYQFKYPEFRGALQEIFNRAELE